MSHPKQTPSPGASPEVKGKPTQANDPDVGLVGLLKRERQNESKDEIIQREINALMAWRSKLIDEQTAKENRVKGKNLKITLRKCKVAKVYAELKEKNEKNPTLKELMRALDNKHPARPKTNEDDGEKPWKEAGVKPWHTALNQSKKF